MSTTRKRRPALPAKDTVTNQNIMSGKVSSGGIVMQGHDAHVTIHQNMGVSSNELSVLFDGLYQKIDARPVDPDVSKEEIAETVKKIENESRKGEKLANPAKLERWMGDIGKMSPDILDVALASMGGPVSGITAVLKKIAERVRKQNTQPG